MSTFTRFNAPLSVTYDGEFSRLQGKDYWLVSVPFSYYVGALEDDVWIHVPEGFRSDGASTPKAIWSFLPPWGVYGQAAVLHDFLCRYKFVMDNGRSQSVNYAKIDGIFLEAMGVLEVPWYKKYLIYAGVRAWHLFVHKDTPLATPSA